MRLIDARTRKLVEFQNHNDVNYSILSHRWEEEEITFQDMMTDNFESKKGFVKFKFSCDEALRTGLPYVWIDTCCIDKSSSAELSEAINSMYKWYQDAKVCYAYLSDVEHIEELARSQWFTRGWTLQELVAPKNLKFYDKNWRCFGSKIGLQARISKITGISTRILRGDDKPSVCSVAQRMSWSATRKTTRLEDQAYSLLGLFDVNIPLLYGEGSKAFTRLQEEIIKTSDDHSIFAWATGRPGRSGILASSPADFKSCGNTVPTAGFTKPQQYSLTNVGLSIRLQLIPWMIDTYMAVLQCKSKDIELEKQLMPHARQKFENERLGILLRRTERAGQFVRIAWNGYDLHTISVSQYHSFMRETNILILLRPEPVEEMNYFYGFWFRNVSSVLFATGADESSPAYKSVSPNTSATGVWSSMRYHDLRTWNESQRAFQSLSDEQQARIYELKPGEQGTVVSFQSIEPTSSETEEPKQDLRRAKAINFGFDFDFNPVCIIHNSDSSEWKVYLRDGKRSLANCQEIEDQLKTYDDMPHAWTWAKYGIYVLKGNRMHGLKAHLKMLNITIEIGECWQGDKDRLWMIDINAISLPHTNLPFGGIGSDADADASTNVNANAGTSEPNPSIYLEQQEEHLKRLDDVRYWWLSDQQDQILDASLDWFKDEISRCLAEEQRLKKARFQERKWIESIDRLKRFQEMALQHIKELRDCDSEYTQGHLNWHERKWTGENEALERLRHEASKRRLEDEELERLRK